ncbi:MAG TPA: GTP-binding protein [Burkholderiales bacterium]|nr:GTP-binding protein [Burkholderiales bacterium]
MIADGRTPVYVITGFLGSGKTTLVNRLVSKQSESLVIVNEFGEIPVDHHLLESSEERTVALPNGCLCCRLRGDLEETLIGAAMRRRRGEIAGFDRVIVETSGLADPGPVAQTLFADQALARDFKLGPVVAVVDAADAGGRAAAPAIARAQIAAADVVVLSKTDRAIDPSIAKDEIHSINSRAALIEARFGELDPALLKSGTDHVFPAAAHPAGIRSFALQFDQPVERALLERFLAVLVDLRGADLLRVKGVVALDNGERVLVQGVRHVFDRLRPVEMPATGLVFITQVFGKEEIEALWRAMSKLKGTS